MAVWTVGDRINVAVVHLYNNVDEQINVFDFRVATGAVNTPANLTADLISLMDTMYSEIETWITDDVVVSEIRWRNITADQPTVYAPYDGVYNGGTGSADALPPQNAALLVARTEVLGVQGKKYLPVFTESSQAYGILVPGALASMQLFADAWVAPITLPVTSAELTPCVYSRTHAALYNISAVQPRVQMAIQRDRRVGRGS